MSLACSNKGKKVNHEIVDKNIEWATEIGQGRTFTSINIRRKGLTRPILKIL